MNRGLEKMLLILGILINTFKAATGPYYMGALC